MKTLHLPLTVKIKAAFASLLHKEFKAPKIHIVISWYFLYIFFFFCLFLASLAYMVVLVWMKEPVHQRKVIIAIGLLGYSHKVVKHFWNHKVRRK
jgi:hypothetical protein